MFAASKESRINSDPDTMISEGDPITDAVKESARQFKDSTRDAASAIKDDLGAVAQRTTKHVRELADSAEHGLADIGDAMAAKIHHHPIQSALVALGIGVVVGMLYRR